MYVAPHFSPPLEIAHCQTGSIPGICNMFMSAPRIILVILILCLGSPWIFAPWNLAHSAPSDSVLKEEEAVIPKKPSMPPALSRKPPSTPYRCQRQFMYQGKLLACDSHLQQDAENMRPVLMRVPAAVEELNTYQDSRKKIRTLAYTGSIGLGLIGASLILEGFMGEDKKVMRRNLLFLPGLTITAGSFIYGITVLKSSEKHLDKAVHLYNDAQPQDPIELRFSTGVSF